MSKPTLHPRPWNWAESSSPGVACIFVAFDSDETIYDTAMYGEDWDDWLPPDNFTESIESTTIVRNPGDGLIYAVKNGEIRMPTRPDPGKKCIIDPKHFVQRKATFTVESPFK